MATFKGRGLVLKELNVGESDKIITLLLKGQGRVNVSVRGGRKPGSKFLSGSQLFSYSDFVIYDGGRFLSLAQVDLIESFYPIRDDYAKLCYGSYFLELTNGTVLDGMPCDELLLLLLRALSALSRGIPTPRQTARAFELKFMQLNGYAPDNGLCHACGNEPAGHAFFGADGVCCAGCASEGGAYVPISGTAARALGRVLATEVSELYRFRLDDNVLDDLKRAAELLIRYYLELEPVSAGLLEDF